MVLITGLTKLFTSNESVFCHRMGGSVQSSDITSALKIKLVIHQVIIKEGILIRIIKTLTDIAFPFFHFSTKVKGPRIPHR